MILCMGTRPSLVLYLTLDEPEPQLRLPSTGWGAAGDVGDGVWNSFLTITVKPVL